MLNKIAYLVITLIILTACDSKNNAERENQNASSAKALEKANKYLIRTEYEDIENYMRRHDLKMEETGTGLRYFIYKKGDGKKAEKGKIAVLDYTLSLITGDVIYSSVTDGQKVFKIGQGSVESGLEEAIHFMHVGDEAKLILPAHLGYGLLGDNNKIPPRSILMYDIELIEIK